MRRNDIPSSDYEHYVRTPISLILFIATQPCREDLKKIIYSFLVIVQINYPYVTSIYIYFILL